MKALGTPSFLAPKGLPVSDVRPLQRPLGWPAFVQAAVASVLTTSGVAACVNVPGITPPRPAATAAPAAAEPPVGAAPAPAPAAVAPAVAEVGLPAPDVEFQGVDGSRRKLSEFKGKFVALVFFAHW